MSRAFHRFLVPVLPLLVLAASAGAQVPLGGAVSDDTTGPLLTGVVYHTTGHVWVEAGKTLTVQPGAVVKFQGGSAFQVHGTLRVTATGSAPAVFTDLRDDTAGGDTNGDGGASAPARGWWQGLSFRDGSTGSLVTSLEVRYTGYGYIPAIACLPTAQVELASVLVRETYWNGLDLSGSCRGAVVKRCRFEGGGNVAVDAVPLDALPGFLDNAASGFAWSTIRVTDGTVGVPMLAVNARNQLNGALAIAAHVVVPAGKALTLGRGVVLKMASPLWVQVYGALRAQGTDAAPVVITEMRDDTVAGDTNGDGAASVPAKGSWLGVVLKSGSGPSACTATEVRYSGYGYVAGLTCEAGAVGVLSRVRVLRSYWNGLFLSDANVGVTVSQCTFEDNGSLAVDGVPLDAVPNFHDNAAFDNGGNYLRVTAGTLAKASVVLAPDQFLNGALVLAAHVVVPAGSALRLEPGAVLKLASPLWVQVHGRLEALGTPELPVVVTELRDDAYGGDTNGDGPASAPAPGTWLGLVLYADAAACVLRDALLRYPGYGYVAGVSLEGGTDSALDHVRVEHAAGNGFDLAGHAGEARGLVAWDCLRGIVLSGGGFPVRQATSVGCTLGMYRNGWAGVVTDSIAWGNGTNFLGFVAGALRFSDGDPTLAGTDGNVFTDPLFVDAGGGDFGLSSGSPCIDAGDPASPPDPDGSRADMGAYPRDGCAPDLYCLGKVNSQGCEPWLDFSGTCSLSNPAPFLVTAHDLINNQFGIFFYGIEGPQQVPWQGGWLCVAGTLHRLEALPTGGNPPPQDCSGSITYDFRAYVLSGHDAALVVGTDVWAQCWARDPKLPVHPTTLTNAIRFRVCP